jgi:hypothetical protein
LGDIIASNSREKDEKKKKKKNIQSPQSEVKRIGKIVGNFGDIRNMEECATLVGWMYYP